ncbi:hypothetical protein V8G54_031919 [Vigna mungo]|uniref:Uncharacterized protein n=1 Tax=Vigna mungo TaxID=3915 RepID=A0AAQ3RG83_VIGMU
MCVLKDAIEKCACSHVSPTLDLPPPSKLKLIAFSQIQSPHRTPTLLNSFLHSPYTFYATKPPTTSSFNKLKLMTLKSTTEKSKCQTIFFPKSKTIFKAIIKPFSFLPMQDDVSAC